MARTKNRYRVIGLNFLNREREMLPDFLEEIDRGLSVVVVVDAQHAKTGRFLNGGELVKAPTRPSYAGNELHIELDRTARNLERTIRGLGPGRYYFSEIQPTR